MAKVGTSLCLGIDPDPDALPDGYPHTAEGIGRFAELILEAAGPFAAAVKVNVAFFERWGSDGVRVTGTTAGPHPAPTCRSSPTPSGATSAPRPPSTRSRCTTHSARMR